MHCNVIYNNDEAVGQQIMLYRKFVCDACDKSSSCDVREACAYWYATMISITVHSARS
jgi:acetone carboxylase gamma subunit